MSAHRRTLGAAAVTLAGAATILLAAVPASATAGISVTRASDGATVSADQPLTSDDIVRVRAQIDPRTRTTDLVILAPGGGDGQVVDEASGTFSQGATMSFDLDTSCVSYDPRRAPCSGRVPAANGTWTAQLRGGASAVTQFTLRIPPAQPDGVTATSDAKGVLVSWHLGAEPDLRSYDVLDGAGHELVSGLSPADVCTSNGACSMKLAPTSATSFSVRAHRATCPSCSETLPSQPSAAASATTSSTATPVSSQGSAASSGGSSQPTAPSGSGSSGAPSTAGSPGGTSSGAGPTTSSSGTTAGSRKASSATSLNRRVAQDPGQLLQQLLPAPSAEQPPTVPASVLAPLADGTYKPKLAYGQQTVGETVLEPDGSAPRVAADSSGSVLDGLVDRDRLWRSAAEGLLLLLACGHLMAWLARTRPE